jgi:hypothetical protein
MKVLLLFVVTASLALGGPIGFSVQSNGNDHLFAIDLATGIATDLGLVGLGDAEGLAFVGGTLFAIGGSEDALWDITAPPGSFFGAPGARNHIDAGLGYDSLGGILYNLQGSGSGHTLYTIDLLTGLATLVGDHPDAPFGDNIAIHSSGAAYAADGIFTDSLYSVDLTDGSFVLIGAFGLSLNVQFGSDFDSGGTLWLLSSDGQIYTADLGTGALSEIAAVTIGGEPAGGWEGLAIQSVPEPGTIAMVVVGGLGLAALKRRRSRR